MFTIKKILRGLAAFCTFFVFMPVFLVSCSGENLEVNVLTAVGGVEMYGEKVVDPHPIMLLCILIPISIIAITFVKKLVDKNMASLIAALTAVDTVLWFVFKSTAKSIADENLCSFETTTWYYINLIFLFFIIGLSFLVIIDKLKMDYDLASVFSKEDTKKVLNQISDKVGEVSGKVTDIAKATVSDISKKVSNINVVGYCTKCGAPITNGSKFCNNCGEPVDEALIAQNCEDMTAPNEKQNKIDKKICANCGAELDQDAKFCESCGTKVDYDKKFCSKCGAEIKDGAKFCKECGNPLN